MYTEILFFTTYEKRKRQSYQDFIENHLTGLWSVLLNCIIYENSSKRKVKLYSLKKNIYMKINKSNC